MGGDGTKKCVAEHRQCVAFGAECGGPGRRTEACCSGHCHKIEAWNPRSVMKCTGVSAFNVAEVDLNATATHPELSISNLSLQAEVAAEGWCQHEGGFCGGPRHLPRRCCSGSTCETLLGGDGARKCVAAHHHCVADGN